MESNASGPPYEAFRAQMAGPVTDKYVAFLRGINVGRANRVVMAELRSAVTDLGYTGVRTLLNSGNVVLEAPETSADELAVRIEATLASRLGLSVSVVVLTAAELAAVLRQNPLLEISGNPSCLMAAILRRPVDRRALEPLLNQDWSPEGLALGQRAVYMWCPAGTVTSPLAKAVARLLTDAVTTTRNWATLLKLKALVDTEEDRPGSRP